MKDWLTHWTRFQSLTPSSTNVCLSGWLATAALPLTSALTLPLIGMGCQSGQTNQKATACHLTQGMTTDQLASCGCFSANNNPNFGISPDPGDASRQAQSVTILNYLCPLGSAGLAKVVVINGIANEVFY